MNLSLKGHSFENRSFSESVTHPKAMYVRRVTPRKMEDIPQPINVNSVKTVLSLLLIDSLDTLCNTKRNTVLDHRRFVQSNICAP